MASLRRAPSLGRTSAGCRHFGSVAQSFDLNPPGFSNNDSLAARIRSAALVGQSVDLPRTSHPPGRLRRSDSYLATIRYLDEGLIGIEWNLAH